MGQNAHQNDGGPRPSRMVCDTDGFNTTQSRGGRWFETENSRSGGKPLPGAQREWRHHLGLPSSFKTSHHTPLSSLGERR
mgnify:CR=1 FL=1